MTDGGGRWGGGGEEGEGVFVMLPKNNIPCSLTLAEETGYTT